MLVFRNRTVVRGLTSEQSYFFSLYKHARFSCSLKEDFDWLVDQEQSCFFSLYKHARFSCSLKEDFDWLVDHS